MDCVFGKSETLATSSHCRAASGSTVASGNSPRPRNSHAVALPHDARTLFSIAVQTLQACGLIDAGPAAESTLCWGAMLKGDDSCCTTNFASGKAHFKVGRWRASAPSSVSASAAPRLRP